MCVKDATRKAWAWVDPGGQNAKALAEELRTYARGGFACNVRDQMTATNPQS
jgi:hypothetical protein